MTRRRGAFLALGQYTDRGAVPLNPHLITRRQLHVVGPWSFAEKHYLRHTEDLPQLSARFDLPRLITRCQLAEADTELADMAYGSVMKSVLDMRPRSVVESAVSVARHTPTGPHRDLPH